MTAKTLSRRELNLRVAAVRAKVDAAREPAMQRFERDWNTRDVRRVADALRLTIPDSTSPVDAARRARALID